MGDKELVRLQICLVECIFLLSRAFEISDFLTSAAGMMGLRSALISWVASIEKLAPHKIKNSSTRRFLYWFSCGAFGNDHQIGWFLIVEKHSSLTFNQLMLKGTGEIEGPLARTFSPSCAKVVADINRCLVFMGLHRCHEGTTLLWQSFFQPQREVETLISTFFRCRLNRRLLTLSLWSLGG